MAYADRNSSIEPPIACLSWRGWFFRESQSCADRSAGLSSYVMRAVYGLARGYEPVSQAAKVRLEKAQAKTKGFVEKFNAVFQTDVEQFKKLMAESGFSLFKPFKQLKVNK